MIRNLLFAAAAARAVADLHALAPATREEHRPAVKRSAERAAKASRLLADHGHLLPPALRQKGQDLLNEHEFRLHVALDSANPGLALAAIEKKESGYLKAFAKLGGDNAVSKARKLPKDDERTKFRATRDVLLAATGVDAKEPVWGAPFRALEALFGDGHAPMEALGVSAKFLEDGTALTKRYHVALQPPCDCWTFGRAAVVEQARGVAESLKAPPLVDTWLDAIAADDTGKLPSIGFGVSADDGACKLYVLNFGGHELPTLPLVDSLPPTARKPDRASSVMVSVEWKFGDAKTQLRQYAVEASADDVSVARHTQGERFAGDELVAALDRAFGVKQSEDIAVTAPFQYGKATTPPVAAAPLAKSGLKLKNGGDLDANADADAKLAALLNNAPGAEAWLARSRVVRHALSNVQFGEGFVTLYRHPTVFGFVDASSAPQHLALRNALAKRTRATRRRLDDMTACDLAEETFMDNMIWGGESECKEDKEAFPGMCPASCQADIEDLIAACDECALTDAVCDATVDTDLYPSLAGELQFEYKAPVVMAGGDMDDDCYKYLDENEDEEGLEGQLEDDMQCLDREPDFDCWVEDDENGDGTATIGCEGCSSDGTQSGFEAAMATFFQNLVASTGGPCSFDASASLVALGGASGSPTTAKYSDLDSELVPDDMKVRFPYGDNGLFDVMSLWGPEGCRYPYYGYLPDAPLCDECSSMFEAKEDILNGLWDGPCNSEDPPGDDDSLPLPPNYPGCGCDCANFLRRDLSTCSSDSCVNVAQEYASPNTVCSGSDVSWDTTSSADGCADTYGDGSFDSTWGDACLDDDGEVQGASEQCYETLDNLQPTLRPTTLMPCPDEESAYLTCVNAAAQNGVDASAGLGWGCCDQDAVDGGSFPSTCFGMQTYSEFQDACGDPAPECAAEWSTYIECVYAEVIDVINEDLTGAAPLNCDLSCTRDPTPAPSHRPTPRPSVRPTPRPTPVPSRRPTPRPSVRATPRPTPVPSRRPTPRPSARPTLRPTPAPSPRPTPRPSARPTLRPTPAPSPRPTPRPSARPTQRPTPRPTPIPSPLPTSRPTLRPTPGPTPLPGNPTQRPTPQPTPRPTPRPTQRPTQRPTPRPSQPPSPRPSPAPTPAPTPAPSPAQTVVEVASSVSLEGVVADEFNADEDMKDAFAQSIIDSSDGVFDEVVDVEAVVRRRRLQAEYPPSPAPTREADRTLAPTRAAAGLADVSYTGVARVDGTEDAEAVSTDLLEKAAAALTTAVDDGSFLTKLRTNAAERSPEAAAAFNAITLDETATRAHIGRASRVFVVTTPEPTAAPTPKPLSLPTPKPTPAPTPRPSLTMSPVSLVSGGGSGSGSGAAGPDAAAMGGGAAAGALVLLLLTAGAFVFYRRTVARDAKANAGPGVVDEAGGLEAPPQTALITSKVDEPPPPPAPGLLARAPSRRGSDAAAAAPPPAPAAAPTTTVRGKKKRGPVKGATAKADSKIRMVFAPMRTWYGAPARRALREKYGQFPPTPDALANWKSFGAVTTAFLDDQGVASTGAPAASAAEPPAAAPPAAAPVTAPSAPLAPEARGWFGWGAGGDPASPSQPLEGVLVTPPTAVPVTASVVASSAPRNFCPTCGNRLADGANFCMACGRSVSS